MSLSLHSFLIGPRRFASTAKHLGFTFWDARTALITEMKVRLLLDSSAVLAPIVQLLTYSPVIGGVWHLPRAHKWPRAKDDVAHLLQEEHDVAMPPIHVQERLVDLYFTYMHPSLPLIHKAQFLADWKAIRNGYVNAAFPPFPPPRLCSKLRAFHKQLLTYLSMMKF